MGPTSAATALLSGVAGALRPDPARAHDWLERELSRSDYHQSLLERLVGWLTERWQGVSETAQGASTLSTAATVALTVLVVALAVVLVARVRLDPVRGGATGPQLMSRLTSPDDHRRAAEAALAEGAPDRALVEAFRALASRSVARGLVDATPGLTADELVAGLAARFPDRTAGLVAAADRFDRVFYGRHPAGVDDALSVLDLDEALRRARPDAAAAPGSPAGTAVPR
jgi:hypothetical protein